MRALVTGGAGFIGSSIVHALVSAGHDVAIIDDLSTGSMDNVHPFALFRRLDVTGPGLAEVVADFAPDVVMHLAAQVSVAASLEDPEHDRFVNVEGTRAVARAAVAAGARRVLFASTAAVYGEPAELPLTEESPTVPAVPYGHSKLAAERVLAETLRPAGIDFACLRLANVYGPRQRAAGEGGVVAEFASRMVGGTERPVIFGTGRQTRDFIFVADVVNAYYEAADCDGVLAGPGDNGPAYNVSTGQATSVSMLAEGLRVALRYTADFVHADARPGDVEASLLDPTKARDTFGWMAAVELRNGLAGTAAWFSQNR